jgi:diguanylate cyclase (GGDEF)-like protein
MRWSNVETREVWSRRTSAELTALEDRIFWEIEATLRTAARIEHEAKTMGAPAVVMRARLLRANMWLRQGDKLGSATREFWEINRWAGEHGANGLLARTHLLLSQTFHSLGDHASSLEHALRAVELLDDTASAWAQVWYRIKLADALSFAGSTEAARERYRQAEQLAVMLGENRLHMAVLNNSAYGEYVAGEPERAWAVAERLRTVAVGYGYELDPTDLDTIGRIQLANGRYAEAEATVQAAIVRHNAGHYEAPEAMAEYLLTLAEAQRGLGALDRAQKTLDGSRALCDERGLADVSVRVRQEQAELYAARGDYADAFATHKQFFVELEQLRSLQREAQARNRHAMFETAEARQEAERFREQARRDPLTGLRNRRFIDEHLPSLIADANTTGEPLAVAIVDLDHFKRINDTLSHEVGDQVLRTVAKLLEAELATAAPTGFAARLGGEEFLIALPGVALVEAARHLDDLRIAVRSHRWESVTGGIPVTVSVGVAASNKTDVTGQLALLSAADRNLYAAKDRGRDRVEAGDALWPRQRVAQSDAAPFEGADDDLVPERPQVRQYP